MVETITPVVHGGSRSRWGISLALHAIGAAVAAAIVGVAPGGRGRAARRAVGGCGRRARRGGGRAVRRTRAGGARAGAAAAAAGAGLVAHVLPAARRGVPVRTRARARVPDLPRPRDGRRGVRRRVRERHGRSWARRCLRRSVWPAGWVRSSRSACVRRATRRALVERLDRSASRARWRVANALALSAVLVATVLELRRIDGPSEIGDARGGDAGADVRGGGDRQARAPSRVEADARVVRFPAGRDAARRVRGSRRRARHRGARARRARVVGGTPVDGRPRGVLRGDRAGTRSGGAASGVRVLRRLGHPGLPALARSQPRARWGGVPRMEGGGGRAARARRSASPPAPTCSPSPSSSSVSRSRCGSERSRSRASAGGARVEASLDRDRRAGRGDADDVRASGPRGPHRPGRPPRYGRETGSGGGRVRPRGRAHLADVDVRHVDRPLDLGSRELRRPARHQGRPGRRLCRRRPVRRTAAGCGAVPRPPGRSGDRGDRAPDRPRSARGARR